MGGAKNASIYVAFWVVILIGWTALSGTGAINPFLLPPPDIVAGLLADILVEPATYSHLALTLGELASAFGLAACGGLSLGLAVGWYELARRAYEPVLANLFAIPLVVLYPVIALWFGLGSASKIAFGALYAFFPVVISTISGVANVDSTLVSAGRSMGARGASLLRTVVLPGALARILIGLRMGLVFATVSVVAGQFIGGVKGLGFLLASAGQAYRTDELFAYVVLTLVFAALLNAVMVAATRLVRREI